MHRPTPADSHPINGFPQVCFTKNTIKGPNSEVVDCTCCDDPEDSADVEHNLPCHFPFIGDRLIIDKFCTIACGSSSS